MKYKPPPVVRRRPKPGEPVRAEDRPQPPTGALAALFTAMGGKPGKTVVM